MAKVEQKQKSKEKYLSWLRCRVHLWRLRGGKHERSGLSRAIGSLQRVERRGKKAIIKLSKPLKLTWIPEGQWRSPVSIQGKGQGVGQRWVPI